jgi:hypothetical protein
MSVERVLEVSIHKINDKIVECKPAFPKVAGKEGPPLEKDRTPSPEIVHTRLFKKVSTEDIIILQPPPKISDSNLPAKMKEPPPTFMLKDALK